MKLKTSRGSFQKIGHNRYSTAGSANNRFNIQPFTVNYRNGNLALAHNGNLTNFHAFAKSWQDEGTIFQTTSDSEIVLHLIARSKQKQQIDQIQEALERIEGAFSLLILTDTSLIVTRDVYGFRPLALGLKDDRFVVASETCAFDMIDATYVRDVAPGEILVIDETGPKQKNYTRAGCQKRTPSRIIASLSSFIFRVPTARSSERASIKSGENWGRRWPRKLPLLPIKMKRGRSSSACQTRATQQRLGSFPKAINKGYRQSWRSA